MGSGVTQLSLEQSVRWEMGDGERGAEGARRAGASALSQVGLSSPPARSPGVERPARSLSWPAFLATLGSTGRTACGSSSLSATRGHYIPGSGQPASRPAVGLGEWVATQQSDRLPQQTATCTFCPLPVGDPECPVVSWGEASRGRLRASGGSSNSWLRASENTYVFHPPPPRAAPGASSGL